MIKEIRGAVLEQKTVEEIVTCDMCGERADHYIEAVTGHREWGNDSCESRESHQFCSWACAVKFMDKWRTTKDGGDNCDSAYIEFDQYDARKNKKSSWIPAFLAGKAVLVADVAETKGDDMQSDFKKAVQENLEKVKRYYPNPPCYVYCNPVDSDRVAEAVEHKATIICSIEVERGTIYITGEEVEGWKTQKSK